MTTRPTAPDPSEPADPSGHPDPSEPSASTAPSAAPAPGEDFVPAPEDVRAYLRRIGAERPERADADALRDLQLRHLRTVPFENLSIHLGEDIVLEEKALLDKVIGAHRGGFCYEVNTAFAVLLRGLGYRVSLLQARVIGPEGRPGIPYDHMALLVETADGERLLADVGFGDHSHFPVRYDDREDQADPGGVFRLVDTPEGDVDVLRDGKPQYRMEVRPRRLADFTAGAWYHRTSPDSHFPRSLVCSLLTEEGRITLSDRKLITRTGSGRDERVLDGDDEVRGAYRDLFGIELDALPVVRGGV
ncbi:arylamine N-acetyltransferase [Streptomyces venezuelae]|uniref:arylamine N-acetyltransferase family protein n=1 Tax=Streptomyces sp. B6(2022) TaxID=3404749 RepID=UPI00311E65B1